VVKRTSVVGHKSLSTKRLVVESLSDIETSNFKVLLTYQFLSEEYIVSTYVISQRKKQYKGRQYITLIHTSIVPTLVDEKAKYQHEKKKEIKFVTLSIHYRVMLG